MGIEPTSEAWEASILPLYDARSLFLIVLRNQFLVQRFGPSRARSGRPLRLLGASASNPALRLRRVPLLPAQAFVSIQEWIILRLDNNLALHAFVPETAGMATLKRVSARCSGQELNRGRFTLLELPTVLRRAKN